MATHQSLEQRRTQFRRTAPSTQGISCVQAISFSVVGGAARLGLISRYHTQVSGNAKTLFSFSKFQPSKKRSFLDLCAQMKNKRENFSRKMILFFLSHA